VNDGDGIFADSDDGDMHQGPEPELNNEEDAFFNHDSYSKWIDNATAAELDDVDMESLIGPNTSPLWNSPARGTHDEPEDLHISRLCLL
jgi:hypothetical protein